MKIPKPTEEELKALSEKISKEMEAYQEKRKKFIESGDFAYLRDLIIGRALYFGPLSTDGSDDFVVRGADGHGNISCSSFMDVVDILLEEGPATETEGFEGEETVREGVIFGRIHGQGTLYYAEKK